MVFRAPPILVVAAIRMWLTAAVVLNTICMLNILESIKGWLPNSKTGWRWEGEILQMNF